MFVYGETFSKVDSNVANVGRNNPDNPLNVNDWNADNDNDNVWAVPAVVSGIKVLWQVLLGGADPAAKHFANLLQNCLERNVTFII